MNDTKTKKICVIGLGYIGLPTACFLAKAGYKVTGVDLDKNKIINLKNKKLPFEEPGLEDLFKKGFKNFEFNLKPQPSDVFIVSVPTPITDNKKPDLKFVKQACIDINKIIKDGDLIIIESTVPAGTAEKVVLPILKKNHKNYRIYIVYAPERAIPGMTIKEMSENDRVIGGTDEYANKLAKDIYSSFVKGKIHLTNSVTAEFVKLIENSYRDINIAFANELAKLCEDIGVNVWEAIKLANLHPRVNMHLPGPGVGGHCISVDPWFLIKKGLNGTKAIKLAREINDKMPHFVVQKVSEMIGAIEKPKITILGAAYKANVDDWRETPALKIIELIIKRNWSLSIYDPLLKDFPYLIEKDFNKATQDSDCIVLVTNHDIFKNINPGKIKNMRNKNIFDSRNFIEGHKWIASGFHIRILGKNGITS